MSDIHFVIATQEPDKAHRVLKSVQGQKHIMCGNANIFQKYNEALNDIRKLEEKPIVCFLHDDITLLDPHFEGKVKLYFSHLSKVGIAGVIGTTKFPEQGGWWMVDRTLHTRGKIMQGNPNGPAYMMNDKPGMYTDLVSVDGCIFLMNGVLAKDFKFDMKTYDGFHFYDVDACFEAQCKGWDVGTIDVLVQHESEGPLPESWQTSREKFISKWKTKGFSFPISHEQFSEYK